MRKYPVVDIGRCTLCGGCVSVAPTVFSYNESLHFIEVQEHRVYPEEEVDEAIKNCPVDCIQWDWQD